MTATKARHIAEQDLVFEVEQNGGYQEWLLALEADWYRFERVAMTVSNHVSFHEANQTMGYNLAKAVPPLLIALAKVTGREKAALINVDRLVVRLRDREKDAKQIENLEDLILDLRDDISVLKGEPKARRVAPVASVAVAVPEVEEWQDGTPKRKSHKRKVAE